MISVRVVRVFQGITSFSFLLFWTGLNMHVVESRVLAASGRSQTSTTLASAVSIANATTSLFARIAEVRTGTLANASQVIEIQLVIRNNYNTRLTAILIELPGEGKGRRINRKDYFMSDLKPGGLRPGEEDVIRITMPALPQPTIKISALLLAGDGADGEEWAVSDLRSGRDGKVFLCEKVLAIMRECLASSGSSARDRLLMIQERIDQLEESVVNRNQRYNSGMWIAKMSMKDWVADVISRNLSSDPASETKISDSILAQLKALQSGISAIR